MDIKSSTELAPFLLKNVKRTGVVLGVGSFGCVEEVSMNGAPCAGKKFHDVLLHPQTQNKMFLVKKLADECRLMSELKHPNIVQFFGLCFFDNSEYPVIVMEKLDSSLDAMLASHSSVPMVLKSMLMQDIAKGLNYLHTQIPPIIHRDITARNILLTPSMMAKIGDLGSARIIRSHGIASVLSRTPGTLVYMPPEANHPTPQYDTALDMFSFGHLSLFIVLQEFPANLLPYTYPDPNNPERLAARTEVERRKNYIDQCIEKLGNKSLIIYILRCCLSDAPQKRPSAAQVLDMLMEKKSTEEQVYGEFRGKMRFDFDTASMKFEGSLGEGVSIDSESREKSSDQLSQQMLRQIKSGEPMVLDKWETVKHGLFKKDRQDHWEQYVFCLEDSTYLRYYRDLKKKPLGEVVLSKVRGIKKTPHRYNYPFEVHFEGKSSPWILRARTGDVRNCWMDSILVNSSSQREPVDTTASEYDEIHTFPSEGGGQGTKQQRRLSNEKEPMFPPSKEAKPVQEKATEVIYDEPFYSTVQNHGGRETHQEPPTPKPDDFAMPDQFKGYTDDELELLAIALGKTLKKRQEQPDTNVGFVDEPRERRAERAQARYTGKSVQPGRIECRKNTGLDTIFEDAPLHNTTAEVPSSPLSEVPPPIPVKKRRHIVDKSPNDYVTEGRTSEGLYGPPAAAQFRQRSAGQSRRRESLRKIANLSARLTKHMAPVLEEGYMMHPIRESKATANPECDDDVIVLPKELMLDKSSIHDLKLISAGNFDRIYKGSLSTADGKSIEVTVKGFFHKSEREKKKFQNEIVILSRIMHPNIVRFYGVIAEDINNMVVLEYMANGNLRTYLQEHHCPVTKLVKFMNDVVMGMHHLSELGLVHRHPKRYKAVTYIH